MQGAWAGPGAPAAPPITLPSRRVAWIAAAAPGGAAPFASRASRCLRASHTSPVEAKGPPKTPDRAAAQSVAPPTRAAAAAAAGRHRGCRPRSPSPPCSPSPPRRCSTAAPPPAAAPSRQRWTGSSLRRRWRGWTPASQTPASTRSSTCSPCCPAAMRSRRWPRCVRLGRTGYAGQGRLRQVAWQP